jgi:hypothetical protein
VVLRPVKQRYGACCNISTGKGPRALPLRIKSRDMTSAALSDFDLNFREIRRIWCVYLTNLAGIILLCTCMAYHFCSAVTPWRSVTCSFVRRHLYSGQAHTRIIYFYLFVVYLTTPSVAQAIYRWTKRLVKYELERKWKEAILSQFTALTTVFACMDWGNTRKLSLRITSLWAKI